MIDRPALIAWRHTVQTSWWSGEADIPTYQAEELLATKLRALYQRSKGRDLFDIWLGLTVLEADPEQITAGFHHYMHDAAFSFPELRDNLTAKLTNQSFLHDLDTLLASTPPAYEPRVAANILMRGVCARPSALAGVLRSARPWALCTHRAAQSSDLASHSSRAP
ncbi:MAG TPA: nucleotidyl transferase AbiEii/AbiGii toxin family protein [Solirubrobacteraceae bacterium]|nr:nucleotidyl transferase AbiEii/AbiGii toxin family protein [Solirubrobacteraceae bacterium]